VQGGASGASGQGGEAGASQGGAAGASQGGAAGSGGGCGACDGPGQACVGGQCIDDCRLAAALPCGPGTVCNVSSQEGGACKVPGDGCVIGNEPQPCGSKVCGSGTACSPSQQCLPALPCAGASCVNGLCVGNSCACERPPASCQPAPLGKVGDAGTLNDPAFTRSTQSQEGLVDLEFDNECNAWGVTIISGTDFVRKITPQGQVSGISGVTNLDMGEVAVLTGKEGSFGGGTGDVALTYTCCATCGCDISATGNPQGAAILDAETGKLPMKIPSDVYTDGQGPFGNKLMDNGPQGLSWGLDRVLYLGNVKVNGDYAALDLLQGVSTTVVTLPERIYASTPFDAERMAVATESGKVFLVPTLGQSFAPVELLTLPSPATSLQRDPWSGRLYAELSNLDIVAVKADGSGLITVAVAPQIGRIALAPDGFVYHIAAYGVPIEIVRFPMLNTL
jgi:hypothetical protein